MEREIIPGNEKQWLSNDLDEICNEILEMQKAG